MTTVNENTNKISVLAQLEAKILRYNELNEIQQRAEEEKSLLKQSIASLMKEHKLAEHRVAVDSSNTVKATLGTRTTTKIDKESLAHDLGISVEAASKKDVLIKKVEEGRLTYEQYKSYEFEETVETVSVRRVNTL